MQVELGASECLSRLAAVVPMEVEVVLPVRMELVEMHQWVAMAAQVMVVQVVQVELQKGRVVMERN